MQLFFPWFFAPRLLRCMRVIGVEVGPSAFAGTLKPNIELFKQYVGALCGNRPASKPSTKVTKAAMAAMAESAIPSTQAAAEVESTSTNAIHEQPGFLPLSSGT